MIGVEGQHVVGAVGRHPGVDPGVAADVPRQPPPAVADRALDERALPRAVGVVVGQRPLVVRPGRLRRRPAQPLHHAAEAGDVVPDERGAEAGRPQLRPDVPVSGSVAVLRLRLQVDMGQHPGAQVVAGGEQRAALTGRDPVEAAAQPGMERHVPAGLEQERVEVRLAELPIAGPRGAGLVGGERSDVNEGRARPDPLDVERGRVLEGHPVRLEFPILSLNRGLRSRCVSPDVWPTRSRA